ncbi:PQ loop repeat-domain-containing protein [Protomyces lactucae-debilis]|uniref:PQ loop repeat-domain-containing protein n=1 Tax=Protomyces lactucae-debilis TaxID=2754530 RepID=A0A1Y2F5B9_PROLT|nr:PQ loop repeat-domain-containing protein [Protomyces lactucae-debilis]ORY79059.1 PQ loop repeat-domain-containing protein [Protomyces lactucae-debilis]
MPPINLNNEAFSSILGSISITAWLVVFTPQIYTNWRRKSAEGLSLHFVVIWLLGDFFNIIGAWLQKVMWVMIVLAIYYAAADVVLLYQCLAYGHKATQQQDEPNHVAAIGIPTSTSSDIIGPEASTVISSSDTAVEHASAATPLIPKELELTKARTTFQAAILNILALLALCMVGTIAWYVGAISSAPQHGKPPPTPKLRWNAGGQIFGWGCAALYLGSRIPQIIHNYKRGSTEGLSALFFLFACLGNITYVGSILIRQNRESPHYHKYLAINASWLAGSAGTLLLDVVILTQTLFYSLRDDRLQRKRQHDAAA